MDGAIDYSDYTMKELFEALSTIKKEKYPINYKNLKSEITKKQKGEFKCPKCGCESYEPGEMYLSSSKAQSIVDIERGKFITFNCLDCGYTEIYKGKTPSWIMGLLDFLN